MSELFATVPFIGDLYFKNIYLYYDEPQIFSCVTSTLQFYFIIAVPAVRLAGCSCLNRKAVYAGKKPCRD